MRGQDKKNTNEDSREGVIAGQKVAVVMHASFLLDAEEAIKRRTYSLYVRSVRGRDTTS